MNRIMIVFALASIVAGVSAFGQTFAASVSCPSPSVYGEACNLPYSNSFSLTTPEAVAIQVQNAATSCSNLSFQITLDQSTIGNTGVLAPGKISSPIGTSALAAGGHTFTVQGTGESGGCNPGNLSNWSAAIFVTRPIDTTALCGNATFCVFDVPTYGSALDAERAFVNAVQGSGNPIGQDNFSEYPIGGATIPPPFSQGNGPWICDATGNCGVMSIGPSGIPGGSGNFVLETEAGLGAGVAYIGFDYAFQFHGGDNCSATLTPSFYVFGFSYQEPRCGFFGVVTNGSLGLGNPIDTAFDNVLWSGATGTITYPDSFVCPVFGTPNIFACIADWGSLFNGSFPVVLDPLPATSYTYQALDGSLFTSLGGFPFGFAAPFDVSSGNTDFGLFGAGQALTFPNGGVSSFTISNITPSVDGSSPTAFPVSVTFDSAPAGVEAVSSPLLVSPSQLTVSASGLAYSRVTRTFNGTLTLTNISSSAISGPFEILLSSLTNGVTLVNATGTVGAGYYLDVPSLSSLVPGQAATVSVEFSDPSNSAIQFTPVAYFAGSD